jgi:hypothetical protein
MWGTEEIGFDPDYSTGFMIVQRVYPTTAKIFVFILLSFSAIYSRKHELRPTGQEGSPSQNAGAEWRFAAVLLAIAS